jgi:hypothetical protein
VSLVSLQENANFFVNLVTNLGHLLQ